MRIDVPERERSPPRTFRVSGFPERPEPLEGLGRWNSSQRIDGSITARTVWSIYNPQKRGNRLGRPQADPSETRDGKPLGLAESGIERIDQRLYHVPAEAGQDLCRGTHERVVPALEGIHEGLDQPLVAPADGDERPGSTLAIRILLARSRHQPD